MERMGRTGGVKHLSHCIAILLVAGSFLGPPLLAREKTDMLILKNGDRITCEIKKLEHGQLYIKTDYTIGTIQVDWDDIEQVQSSQRFQVEMTNGERHEGLLRKQAGIEAAEPATVMEVVGDEGTFELEQKEIVLVRQLERGFWGNLDGSVDYGFSFTKANSQTQSTLNGSIGYTTEGYSLGVTVSSLLSRVEEGENTNRHNATIAFEKYLPAKWFALGIAEFLHSDEQNLSLRTTYGGGLGRYLLYTNHNVFRALGGAVINTEKFTPESGLQPSGNDLEALLGIEYSTFQFDRSDLTSQLLVYPSISELGRTRASFRTSLTLELVDDLYWRLSVFDDFDSKPPAATAKNDFGVTASVGYSF